MTANFSRRKQRSLHYRAALNNVYIVHKIQCIMYTVTHHKLKPATTKLFSTAEIGGHKVISLVFVNTQTPRAVSHTHDMGFGKSVLQKTKGI